MTSDALAQRLQPLMQQAVEAQQHGDFAAAEARYREILHVMPEHSDATHFLGLLAHQTGHPQAAVGLLERSIALGPGSPLYRHNLAGVFREQGRHADAEKRYREAIALRPDYVDAFVGLAMSLAARNRHHDALAACRRAIELEPRHFDARMGYAAALIELTRYSEALTSYREIRALAAGNAEQLHRLGLALRDAGAAEESVRCFKDALALRPDLVEAHNSLGIALGDLGDFAAAEQHYREALRLRPAYVSAWHNLASISRIDRDPALYGALQTLAETIRELPEPEASMLHFVLGKVHDDAGDYARAFEHFLEGNRLKRMSLDYDETRQVRFFHDFIGSFDRAFFENRSAAGTASDMPIFIVGMSRSGTTLVEQILASHPQVHGAGELQLLRRCLHLECGGVEDDQELPARLAQLGGAAFTRIGDRYVKALAELAPGAARVTDKLPGNMALVGVIHLAFSNARIIHCTREPLDTCVSCFSKLFTTGHAFSYELGELGRFYRLYQELMRHWNAVLPQGRMLEMRYEEVIADTETQVRRLLEFCGLPWNEVCLNFSQTRRAVKTASLAQVRQPIYAGSVGRWQRYREFLAPLEHALSAD
ncbi:MAG TPA: sulfotransferase [Gammaproteobacteria bacterium]|nr:sulfotransferase [Gammaproteobacteria bacterium]